MDRNPWELRHRVTRTVREEAGPAGVVRSDGVVPLTGLSDFVASAKAAAGTRRLHVFGHVGIGIVHCLLPLGGPSPWTRDDAVAEKTRLAILAVSMGGAVSGEHGVGLGLRDVLGTQSPALVARMRALKKVFDPAGILNPGKVFCQVQGPRSEV